MDSTLELRSLFGSSRPISVERVWSVGWKDGAANHAGVRLAKVNIWRS